MKRILYYLIFFAIVGFGFLGLFSSILHDPAALLVQVFILGLVIAFGLFLFKKLVAGPNKNAGRYRKAAKLSKKRRKGFGASWKTHMMRPSRLKVISTDSNTKKTLSHLRPKDHGHLTVIEGKKNKRKKRVLF